MITKLQAARLCKSASIEMVIANGKRADISRIVAGEKIGTRFTL